MSSCIELNTTISSEMTLDSKEIRQYLDINLKFIELTDKQIKKKIIEILLNEQYILTILDELDINYKYFIELLYMNYSNIFTTSFINKHIKKTYNMYKNY